MIRLCLVKKTCKILSTMRYTIIPVLLWNISEKKTWFTVGFSCTKWHYLILVTLSADNHRLLDFLFRFPQIFFSKCVSRKNWKRITYRVAAMNQNVVWISHLLLVSQIKSIIIFRFYVVWYYEKKKFDYVASNDSGKNHMKVYVLGSSLDV